uniref:Uncharacterized protein n=1 Tax=Triticum urartu TaxID=4572 RepID=A0A8R7VC07_TRIUA
MLPRPPSPGGIEPSSRLMERSRCCRDDRLASDAGTAPVKLLFVSESFFRLVSVSPRLDGMRPPSLLLPRTRAVMPVQRLMLSGSMPESELSLRSSVWSRRRWPRLAGMLPWNQLKLRLSVCNDVRFPMAARSVPASPREDRSRATTLPLLPPQVTPSQLQKLVLLFHELSGPELLPLVIPALKASKAAPSSSPWLLTLSLAAAITRAKRRDDK